MVLCKLKNRIVGCVFISIFACLSLVAQETNDPLFPIEQHGKWGYIDRSGKIVVAPRFDYADEFYEGLAVIKLDEKWGYIDATGKLIIEAQYSSAKRFSEGLARVQVGGDKYGLYGQWGFIDRTGRMVIAPQFENMEGAGEEDGNFHDGLAMIEVNYLKGFIDKTGTTVIRPRFRYAYYFSEGIASVTEGTDKTWGYIDKTGAWVIAPKFEWASSFSEGLGPVSLQGKCGYVDKTGELKLIPEFKHKENDCAAVWGSFDNGLSRWMVGNKYGYINTRGELVTKPEFDLTFNFSEGLAFVQQGDKYGFIDQTGRFVIEPQFYYAKDFHNGLARVRFAPDSWGYIDKRGQPVWKDSAAPAADTQANNFLQFGHTSTVLFVGWDSDGKGLASYSGSDGSIKHWNAITGQLIWDIKTILLKPDAPLKSPDGAWVASGVKGGSFEISDAQSRRIIWTIKDGAAGPERVTSPDGSLIAQLGRYGDAGVNIFEARSDKLLRRLEGHPGVIEAIAFSPDGKIIASGSGDKLIRFWNPQNGTVTRTLSDHIGKITSLAFSGDGKRLISGSEDDTIKIWNVADGHLLRSIRTFTSDREGVKTVALSNDGQTALSSGGLAIKVWNTATGEQLNALTTNEPHIQDHGDGMQSSWCCGSEVHYVTFNSSGNRIVSAHEDNTMKLWDATNGQLLRVIHGSFENLRMAVFSPDGRIIAAGYDSPDTRVEFWSAQTGKLLRRLGEDSGYTHSLSFSRDGSMIAISQTSDVEVWNLRTGKRLRRFIQPHYLDDQVAFSPDGKYVVSGGKNQNILLWNVAKGSLHWSAIPIDWESEKREQAAAVALFAKESARETERRQKAAAADKKVSTWVRPVTIIFDHYGDATNPLEQRMMETGAAEKSLITKSAADADGVWLRLRNNSSLPISFRTVSGYLPRPGCGVKLSDGSKAGGLCDGAEVSIQYQIEEANGKSVPWGLDMSWTSVLPPGASVLFSVSKEHLANHRSVSVSFTYLKENEQHELEEYGTARRVSFRRRLTFTQ